MDTDVLIVGAGPVGLLGAHLLGNRGVCTIVAEKYPSRLSIPKAHALNPRSLEICSAAGLPMDVLHAAGTPAHEGGFVRFMTTLAGTEIGKLPYERQDAAVKVLTPWPLINIAQPNFQKVLEDSLPDDAPIDVRTSLEWLGYEEAGGGVISTLRPRGGGKTVTIKSRYLLGADGAMSAVRNAAQIELSGQEALAHCITIHFEADLSALVASRPAILYFLFGVKRGAALIAYDISKTWVLMHRFDPKVSPPDSFTHADYEAAIRAALGTDFDFEIKAARPWTMSSQVAKRYKKGRVFLVGDAAHRFPPTGGLGLNTGLGDIDNLAWKIAAVKKEWADEALLESYEDERQYVAQTNASQSAGNAQRMRALTAALGQGPSASRHHERTDFEIEQDLLKKISDPKSQGDIKDGIALQKQHFDSLRLQMGYIYGAHRGLEKDAPIDRYTPKSISGAHLPHALIKGQGSIFDLLCPDSFTLLTGKDGAAFKALENYKGAPIKVLIEGQDFTAQKGDWAQAMGLAHSGALLIRPDRHILERIERSVANSQGIILAALSQYLGPKAQPR